MCYDYVIVWACGHTVRWDFVSCEMGNRPLAGGCPTGAVATHRDLRIGNCPACIACWGEREEARRRKNAEEATYYARQAIDTSKMGRPSLITEGLKKLNAGATNGGQKQGEKK